MVKQALNALIISMTFLSSIQRHSRILFLAILSLFIAVPSASASQTVINGCWIKEAAQCHGINLKGADLRNANLKNADMSNTNLEGANLEGANLTGANFSSSTLKKANLRHVSGEGAKFFSADATGADMAASNWHKADFHQSGLSHVNLSASLLQGSTFNRANLNYASLSGSQLDGSHMYKTNLSHATTQSTNFAGTNFTEADLSHLHARGANFYAVNLSHANLYRLQARDASFHGSNLTSANFHESMLEFANFGHTHFHNTTMTDSKAHGARFTSSDFAKDAGAVNALFFRVRLHSNGYPRGVFDGGCNSTSGATQADFTVGSGTCEGDTEISHTPGWSQTQQYKGYGVIWKWTNHSDKTRDFSVKGNARQPYNMELVGKANGNGGSFEVNETHGIHAFPTGSGATGDPGGPISMYVGSTWHSGGLTRGYVLGLTGWLERRYDR